MTLPILPSGFKYTNAVQNIDTTENTAKKTAPNNTLVFLGLIVAVLLLISTFILGQNIEELRPRVPDEPQINFEEVNYPSDSWKNRINNTLNAARSEKDTNQKFELYSQVFYELLSIYDTDHDSKSRNHAAGMAEFISKKFPTQYKAGNFKVPCLDLECGKPNYPEETLSLKEKIRTIKSIDSLVLESIFNKFDSAAFSKDTNSQWENYLAIFNSLVSEKRRTNDEGISKVAQDFRDFLKKNYTENYSQIEGSIPGVFDI